MGWGSSADAEGRGVEGRTQAAALAAQWRGVAAEDADQITAPVSALLRGRSHRLLRSLLRPHKRALLPRAPTVIRR